MLLSERFKKRLQELSGIKLTEFDFNALADAPHPEPPEKPNMDGAQIEILPVTFQDFKELLDICDKTIKMPGFEDVCSRDPRQRVQQLFQTELSFKATVNGKAVGFYFCSTKENMEEFVLAIKKIYGKSTTSFDENLFNELKNKRGVQGVAIGVLEEYRDFGIGRMLINKPKELGFDYIWGVQTQHISDTSKWLKRRQLLMHFEMDSLSCDITVEKF